MKTYLPANDIELVHSGKHYFDVLETLIQNSKSSLHLQTYIFECDETGLRILSSLIAAAGRGVKVTLLLDGFGSFSFPSAQIDDLLKAGIQFRFFSPFLSTENRFIGRRLHHKIAVADKYTGLITGINIGDKYNSNKGPAWLDFGIYTKGDLNQYLHQYCEQFYNRSSNKLLAWEKKLAVENTDKPGGLVRYRRNDWLRRHNEIHRSYVEAITKARASITIVATYFLPGNNFRSILRNAAKRGVEIKIILAGKSDLPSVQHAENYLFDFYLRNKIQIFEWKESVLHGKAMIVDSNWATVGSYNLNFLSHYFSSELNADVMDPVFILKFEKELNDIIENHCTAIDLEAHYKKQNPLRKMVYWLSYNFFRLLMNTFMLGRKFRKRTDH
ncbi:MAG: phospholipase D-like domain-containing protein [bacterium]|nr:phospholipase D-like domain-containing protein [bacterium]